MALASTSNVLQRISYVISAPVSVSCHRDGEMLATTNLEQHKKKENCSNNREFPH
jgi:hypothetical protein